MTFKKYPFLIFERRSPPPYNREDRIRRQIERRVKYLKQAGRYYQATKEQEHRNT